MPRGHGSDSIELRQLRYFRTVVDAGGFVRGADRLRLAQPALSRSIAKLEDELGHRLLHRHSGGVSLTEAGARFYEHAGDVLRRVQTLQEDMAAEDDGPRGRLILGAPSSLQALVTAPVIAEYLGRYRHASASFHEETSAVLRDEVASGAIELAIIATNVPPRGLRYVPLVTQSLCVLASREVAEGFGDEVRLENLYDRPLATTRNPNAIRQTIEAAAGGDAWRLHVRCALNSTYVMMALASEGAAIGVAPACMSAQAAQHGLVMRPIEGVRMSWALATSRGRADSRGARRMSELIVGRVRRVIAEGLWPTAVFDYPPADLSEG